MINTTNFAIGLSTHFETSKTTNKTIFSCVLTILVSCSFQFLSFFKTWASIQVLQLTPKYYIILKSVYYECRLYSDRFWNQIDRKTREKLDLQFNQDGEFYMNFNRDFMKVCYIFHFIIKKSKDTTENFLIIIHFFFSQSL